MGTSFHCLQLSHILIDRNPSEEAGGAKSGTPEVLAHSQKFLVDLMREFPCVCDDDGLASEILSVLAVEHQRVEDGDDEDHSLAGA